MTKASAVASADSDSAQSSTSAVIDGVAQEEEFRRQLDLERADLVASMIQLQNQSHAAKGEVLPPPPKGGVGLSLWKAPATSTKIDESNDPLATTTTSAQSSDGLQVANVEPILIPRPLRALDFDAIQSRADLVMQLTRGIPLNDQGLPKYLYRVDVLDLNLFRKVCESTQPSKDDVLLAEDILEAAKLYLNYEQGFPTLPSGEPIWGRLPFEDELAHAAYTSYTLLAGARQLHKVEEGSIEQRREWFHTNYWTFRAKAYDLMSIVHAAKKREQRMLACDDDHYVQLNRVLKRLTAVEDEVDWGALAAEPDKFVAVMEKVVKLQRQILGLMANNGTGVERDVKTESLEVQLRKLAAPEGELDGANGGSSAVGEGVDIRELLRDPTALTGAQDLIIRMTSTKSKTNVGSQYE